MSDKIKPEDNKANTLNSNEGTDGYNQQYLKDQENRKKQAKENAAKKTEK
jgi:hypothetical protein